MRRLGETRWVVRLPLPAITYATEAPTGAPRLRHFLSILTPVVFAVAAVQFAAFAAFVNVPSALGAILLLGYGATLILAEMLLDRGRINEVIGLVAGGLVVFSVPYALLVPSATAVAVIAPTLAVAIALPYAAPDRLRILIVTCWLATVVIVALLQFSPPSRDIPVWIGSSLQIVQVAAVVALVMFLLWEFSTRLKSAMNDMAAATAASRDAQETVRRVNRELRRRVAELERRNREATLVGHMGSLLEVSRTAEEAYDVIERASRTLFPGTAGAVFTLPPSRVVVEVGARWGDPPPHAQVFAPEDCWALRQGRLHIVEAPQLGPRCGHVANDPDRPYVCIPMTAQGATLGVFHVAGGRAATTEGHLDEDVRALALWVAELLALSLANFRLRETLQLQSTRDPLTGLFNRRYMEESLEREIYRATREGQPLGVIMLDLDHFKRYNDHHGHAAGDAVLRDLGQSLRESVRGEDIACRYGGEEFTIILPNATRDDTRRRAELLRETAREMRSEVGITLSLGVAAFPEDGTTAEAVLEAADRALYEAKAEGRDRVRVATGTANQPGTAS